jgi:hypothetical protein
MHGQKRCAGTSFIGRDPVRHSEIRQRTRTADRRPIESPMLRIFADGRLLRLHIPRSEAIYGFAKSVQAVPQRITMRPIPLCRNVFHGITAGA